MAAMRGDIGKAILGLLRPGGSSHASIAAAIGFPGESVRRTLGRMASRGMVRKTKRGWWELIEGAEGETMAKKTETEAEILAEAIRSALTSPNVADANWEAANLVDTTQRMATGLHRIADALEKIAAAMSKE